MNKQRMQLVSAKPTVREFILSRLLDPKRLSRVIHYFADGMRQRIYNIPFDLDHPIDAGIETGDKFEF